MTTVEDITRKLRELPPDALDEVEHFVETLRRRQTFGAQPAALDVLATAPGQRAFRTAEEVRTYLDGERDAWDR